MNILFLVVTYQTAELTSTTSTEINLDVVYECLPILSSQQINYYWETKSTPAARWCQLCHRNFRYFDLHSKHIYTPFGNGIFLRLQMAELIAMKKGLYALRNWNGTAWFVELPSKYSHSEQLKFHRITKEQKVNLIRVRRTRFQKSFSPQLIESKFCN